MLNILTKNLLIGIILQVIVSSNLHAQDIIKAKFRITEIPTIYLKGGQRLELTVDTTISLTLNYSPIILGSLGINENNLISFNPDLNDLQPITVSLSTNTDTFSFTIIPQFYIEPSSSFLPYNVGSTLYATNFFRVIIDSNVINNKHLIIEGKEIVFDDDLSNTLNEQLFKESEIEYPYTRVSIFAEKLIVKTKAWFPGVKLNVNVKYLVFDASNSTPSLNITPYKYWTPENVSTKKSGDKGRDCDSMVIFYKTLELNNFPTNVSKPKLFVANGGQGETAPYGRHGVPYPKVELITNFTTIPVSPAASNCGRRDWHPATSVSTDIVADPRNSSLVHIWFNKKVPSSYTVVTGGGRDRETFTQSCEYQQRGQIDLYSKIFTTETLEKAKPIQGGIPGKGGNGGTIISNQNIRDFISFRYGNDGKYDTIRKSGAIDGPRDVWSYQVDNVTEANNKGYVQWYYPQEFYLNPLFNNSPGGVNGNFVIENNSTNKYKSIRYAKFAIEQANELFRFGYIDSAASVYYSYLNDFFNNQINDYSKEDSLEYEILVSNARINQSKIYANLDYYGNPNNWVPKLNIVLNYALYKVSLENNFQLISKALYFLKELKKNKKGINNLKSLLNNLSASNTDFQFKIENLTTKEIPELQLQMGLVDSYIKMLDNRLKQVEALINSQAEGIIKERERKAKQKAFFKTLTGIAKVIPIYQPALGLAATAIEAFALKEGGEGVINNISYFSTNYSEMKKNQTIMKENLNNALEKSKNSAGNISISAINNNKDEISKSLSPIIKTIDGILKRTSYQPMPADALAIEIARLKEENIEYKGLIDSMAHLVSLNKGITDKIIKISSEISNISTLLHNNISATLAIKIELSSAKPISQTTISMIEKVKSDALSNILYYQYLFAKSYEYFTLTQYKGYAKTAPLFNALPNIDAEVNPDNIYTAIETLYKAEVNSTIESSISGLNTYQNIIPLTQEQTFELTKSDIDIINKQDTLKINLFRDFNYNVLRKKLSSYDDILIKDIKIVPHYDNSAIDAFKNSGFAKSSIIVSHTGNSKRYYNEKTYSFNHLKEENNMPRVWRLDYDFKSAPSEKYVEFDQTYLQLLCEFINKQNSDFCKNNIKSDVGYDSDLWIYKDDNQADGSNIKLDKLSLTISFSAKNRINSSSKSIVSFYSFNKEAESVVFFKYKGVKNNFINFNYLVLDRNEQLEIFCEPKHNGKAFKYWSTNNGNILQNNYTLTLSSPYYYFIPIYE